METQPVLSPVTFKNIKSIIQQKRRVTFELDIKYQSSMSCWKCRRFLFAFRIKLSKLFFKLRIIRSKSMKGRKLNMFKAKINMNKLLVKIKPIMKHLPLIQGWKSKIFYENWCKIFFS